jgi:hypothetical protein
MTGIKFLKSCSFHVHESEFDEEGSLESFKENEITGADVCTEHNDGTIDLQFGDGSVAFNIPKTIIEVVKLPL